MRRAADDLGYRASVLTRTLSSGTTAPLRCAIAGLGPPLEILVAFFCGPVLAGLTSETVTQREVQLLLLPGLGGTLLPGTADTDP